MSSVEEDLLRRKEEISGAIKICQDEISKIDQIEKNSIVEEFYANLKAKQEEKLKILQEKSSEISSLLYCTVDLISEGGSLTFEPSTVEVSRFRNELPSISFKAFDENGVEETSTVFQGSFCRVDLTSDDVDDVDEVCGVDLTSDDVDDVDEVCGVDLTFEYNDEVGRYVLTEHEGSYTVPKFSHGIYLSLSDGTGRGLKGKNRIRFIRFARIERKKITQSIKNISKKDIARLLTGKWNKLHPDLKVDENWVYWMI